MAGSFKIILSLGCFFTISAVAIEKDPFDHQSCTGPLMSGKRALELLKEESSITLAQHLPKGQLNGIARFRQKINGAIGAWYPTTDGLTGLIPLLINDHGKLGLSLAYDYEASVYGKTQTFRDYLSCEQIEDSRVFKCSFKHWYKKVANNAFFIAELTDSCLRITSEESNATQDVEWAYLLELPTTL